MFISPRIAIENGWLTHPNCQSFNDWETNNFVSPNAIDFTIDSLYRVNVDNLFVISEDGKQMRGTQWYDPILDRAGGQHYWTIKDHSIYDGMSSVYVNVPDGIAAILFPRSSFTRNGIFLTSGLYDSGFSGHIGFVLHNRAGRAKVYQGTRIGQIAFVESDNASSYAGGWNHEKGTHYTESDNVSK